jgi:hypothetical protein
MHSSFARTHCRRSPLVLGAMALSLSAAGLVLANEFPLRKAGFWKHSITGVDASKPVTGEYCVDAASDKKLLAQSTAIGNKDKRCTSTELRLERGTYVQETSCPDKDAVVLYRTEVKGNFNTQIVATMTSTRTPPNKEQPAATPIVNTAVWSGACPEGWKPGEFAFNGGPRIDIHMAMDVANKVTDVANKVTESLKGLFGR